MPNRRLILGNVANDDGGNLTNAFYGSREIVVSGNISSSNAITGESRRDTLLSYLYQTNATIKFEQANSTRVYTGTLSDTIFSEDNKGGLLPFDLKFNCPDPFGYEQNQLQVVATNLASGTGTSVTNNGSYFCYPIIWLKALTSYTLIDTSLSVSDGTRTLTVIRTWLAGDTLVVDGINRTVKVNGTVVTYYGAFPQLAVGSNTITNGGGFPNNVDKTVKYTQRYL